MSSRPVEFPEKDEPLRRDVRELGALVGEMLREQGGEALFERVETARRAAIADRRGDPGAARRLEEELEGVDVATAVDLVRAFSAYFRVVNLAEKVHRIRRRRDYQRDPDREPQRESLRALLRRQVEARGAQATRVRVEELLRELRLEPVFTAHPTEATRRVLLEKEQHIARLLVDRLDPSRTVPEERALLARIRSEITLAWQTEEHEAERPTVADEREHVLFYLTDVLYRILPVLYEHLEDDLEAELGETIPLPHLFVFGSWVGGDMDGNPNVDAGTIEATLGVHRSLVLELYRREVDRLARQLTQSPERVAVHPWLLERTDAYGESFPEAVGRLSKRHRSMPYRTFLSLVAARLAATGRDEDGGYPGPESFAADIDLVARSLGENRGSHAGLFQVRRLQRRLETFGFHLVTLDVRQDAQVFRRAVGELIGDRRWPERSAEERLERLLAEAPPRSPEVGGETAATLEVFRAVDRCRRRLGSAAIGPMIVSMTEGADDLLGVLWLAEAAGAEPQRLDVCPLFETVPDLEAAPRVMASLLALPRYRRHLEQREQRQVVMVGYSDSAKEGGVAASRWALQRAQEEVSAVLHEAGVQTVFFHGRGGTVGRGGSKGDRSILAAPARALRGGFRVTEQGEVIDERYGLRAIALRNLERMLASTVGRLGPGDDLDVPPEWRQLAETVAQASRRAYRSLVYDQPAFSDFFRGLTPIDVVERMPIGSRPASRRAQEGIEDLRAIPWVFSWIQCRLLLPSWYGLGSGLGAARERFGLEALREALAWPFFDALVADVESALGKVELGVARRYLGLVNEPARGLFETVEQELEQAVASVLELRRQDRLLEGDPVLQRAITLRNPYVDPLNLLQVDLLRRWRESGRDDDRLFDGLLQTVNGIALGMQATG